MLKAKTIQSRLFITYSSFIMCIIVVFVLSFYIYISGTLEKKGSESLYQLSAYITSQLDTELKNMNLLSEKILFSQPIMELFFTDLYELNNKTILSQWKFNELVYSITGPQFPVFQINMFQIGGESAQIGINNNFTRLSSDKMDDIVWLQDVMKLKGTKYITKPAKNSPELPTKTVISLCRSFSDQWGQEPNSILEIQQDFDVFTKIIHKALETPDSSKKQTTTVLVFNSSGELIYPSSQPWVDTDTMIKTYWNQIKKDNKGSNTFTINNKNTDTNEILAYTYSDFSSWTIAVSESEDVMLNPVKKFRNNTFLAGLLVLIITLVISYFVSRRITGPIKKIHKNIKNLNLETIPSKSSLMLYSGINELEDLNRSFADMCKRLKSSLEEAVLSKSHEIQARMLALQSQMNPHFLYNTITVISIMAEEEGKPRVVKACADLCSMLRYICSDDTAPVTIHQELDHTLGYLSLMKLRYGNDLHFEIHIPEEMLDIKVPKLILQPLVENCTKYAINVDPPWKFVVQGRLCPTSWEISVHDNGQGFEEKWLAATIYKLKTLDPYNNMPGLKLDGMGLINIFIRLKLMYGTNAIFKMENHPDGGAMITVGGSF